MKPRNTLILVALFALLAAYVYFVELNRTPDQLGTPTPTPFQYVFQLDPSQVQKIEISDLQVARQTVLARSDQGWRVTVPIEKMADQDKVVSTLNGLASLRANRVLTNVTSLAPFGLLTGTLEVRTVMSDTKAYAIIVGDKAPDGNSYYVSYTGDKTKVFLIDTALADSTKALLDKPPYEPTPTPSPTATPPVTETPASLPTPAGTPTP